METGHLKSQVKFRSRIWFKRWGKTDCCGDKISESVLREMVELGSWRSHEWSNIWKVNFYGDIQSRKVSSEKLTYLEIYESV